MVDDVGILSTTAGSPAREWVLQTAVKIFQDSKVKGRKSSERYDIALHTTIYMPRPKLRALPTLGILERRGSDLGSCSPDFKRAG